MKISPSIYAHGLIATIETKKNLKNIAFSFLKLLDKNQQRADLKKIIDSLDQSFAESQNKVFVRLISPIPLKDTEQKQAYSILHKKIERDLIIKYEVDPSTFGIIAILQDQEINLDINNKIKNLKKALINN